MDFSTVDVRQLMYDSVFFQNSKLKNGSIFVLVSQNSSIGPWSLDTEKHAKSIPGPSEIAGEPLSRTAQNFGFQKYTS